MNAEEKKHNTNGNEEENITSTGNVPIEEDLAEDVKDVQVEIKVGDVIKELNDKYLRMYAEFENYKRRTNKERLELLRTANEETIVSMLPVLDDFERALKAIEESNDQDAIKEGIRLIYNKLKGILEQKGLKAMESIGQLFNSDLHEAITSVPVPSSDMKGKVVDEIEKGYLLNDKVVRFAKVVVGE